MKEENGELVNKYKKTENQFQKYEKASMVLDNRYLHFAFRVKIVRPLKDSIHETLLTFEESKQGHFD